MMSPAPAKGVVPPARLAGRLSCSQEAPLPAVGASARAAPGAHTARPLCSASRTTAIPGPPGSVPASAALVASSAVLRDRRNRTKQKQERQVAPKSRPGSCRSIYHTAWWTGGRMDTCQSSLPAPFPL